MPWTQDAEFPGSLQQPALDFIFLELCAAYNLVRDTVSSEPLIFPKKFSGREHRNATNASMHPQL